MSFVPPTLSLAIYGRPGALLGSIVGWGTAERTDENDVVLGPFSGREALRPVLNGQFQPGGRFFLKVSREL